MALAQVNGTELWYSIEGAGEPLLLFPGLGLDHNYYRLGAPLLKDHFKVVLIDPRGIGQSRPRQLRGAGYRWRDWGERDFDAALRWMAKHRRNGPLMVVGHSIGGFLPGLAESAPMIDRMLTVGAQYAWWGDYMASRRLALLFKWHVAMPMVTAPCLPASRSAATVNGVVPEAATAITTSCGDGRAASICRTASPTSSSAPSTLVVNALSPPAMMKRSRSCGQAKVGVSSAPSCTATRPDVPAPT